MGRLNGRLQLSVEALGWVASMRSTSLLRPRRPSAHGGTCDDINPVFRNLVKY
jgi:hypothetical protein